MPYTAGTSGPFLSTTGRISIGLSLNPGVAAHYDGFAVRIDTESVHSYAYWCYVRLYGTDGIRHSFTHDFIRECIISPPFNHADFPTWFRSIDCPSVLTNLLHFQQCTLTLNPLIRDLAQRGGPSLASYFPYIRFIEPDYVLNAFIRPNFTSPAFGLVSIPHINLAHSQGFALIVVLNCYSWAEHNLYANGVLNRNAVTSNPRSMARIFFPHLNDLPLYQRDFRSFFISLFSHHIPVPPLDISVSVLDRINKNCVSISLFPLPRQAD